MQKEVAAYEKEVVDNTAKLNAMEADEADPYDIKRFKEVLAESVMMVPDSKNRLGKAVEDLELFCDTSAELEGVQTSEWWAVATAILAANKKGGAEKEETKVDDLAEGEAF
mmetsp:Transcript_28093/g.56097  ORF Transcript_28093/g.56097 Transcript_28093/m.56097 type:complete len:111 (+) Transcript_28093:317-649(+)